MRCTQQHERLRKRNSNKERQKSIKWVPRRCQQSYTRYIHLRKHSTNNLDCRENVALHFRWAAIINGIIVNGFSVFLPIKKSTDQQIKTALKMSINETVLTLMGRPHNPFMQYSIMNGCAKVSPAYAGQVDEAF